MFDRVERRQESYLQMYRFAAAIIPLVSGWLLVPANADIQTASLPLEEFAETRTGDYRLGPGDVINITDGNRMNPSLSVRLSDRAFLKVVMREA